MKTIYDIIDDVSTWDDKPHWWPVYWLNFREVKEYEIFYSPGQSVIIEARCTREAILIFEYNCPDLNWYFARLAVVPDVMPGDIDVPF